MTTRTIRVTVRGHFDHLGPEQIAALVADAAAHDFLRTEYTADGYLAYDLPARPFFTFRFAEQAADVETATARATAKASAWMAEHGYAVKNLTTQAVDLAEVPLGSRGRREASRRDA